MITLGYLALITARQFFCQGVSSGFAFVCCRVWDSGSCPHLLFGLTGEPKNLYYSQFPLNGCVLVCEVAMSQAKTSSISVIALRADDYSLDGRNVIISLTTKYSAAERKYSVPIECFHDLIVDLQRLNAAARATPFEPPIPPAVAPNRAEDVNRLMIATAA